jgi:hypothetical protein
MLEKGQEVPCLSVQRPCQYMMALSLDRKQEITRLSWRIVSVQCIRIPNVVVSQALDGYWYVSSHEMPVIESLLLDSISRCWSRNHFCEYPPKYRVLALLLMLVWIWDLSSLRPGHETAGMHTHYLPTSSFNFLPSQCLMFKIILNAFDGN